MIILLTWIAVFIALIALYYRGVNSRYKKYGVKYNTPIPLVGNMMSIVLRSEHMADNMVTFYNEFPEERFTARFEFLNEVVVIRDLDLIKQIGVKDFEYFLDHRPMFGETNSFFARTIFALKGQEWKDMRSTLSPAFTSSKIRVMVPFMVEVGDQMITELKKKIKNSNTGYIDIDCKDLTTRYGNDVIASCAFGLKVNSFVDVDNTFYVVGKEAATFGQTLKFFFIVNLPKIAKILNIDIMTTRSKDFFRNLVLDTMKERELKNIIRPDMIHLLMEVKKGRLTHEVDAETDLDTGFATVKESKVGTKEVTRIWAEEDLVAQAVLFFIAGFEGISSVMCFLFYELAVNPDVQDLLAQEIREHDAKNNGRFDFNSIQNMTYLDMVTSELLRKWTPGAFLDRVCNKDYNLGKPNKDATEDFIIRKGTGIAIPTFAIHRDPQYFPDPLKFDPERFSEENKHKIQPFTYMPFGVGPRNCVGSRFALCELKAIVYQILLHLELSPSDKTVIPAKLLPSESFNFRMVGGHHLRFKIRP